MAGFDQQIGKVVGVKSYGWQGDIFYEVENGDPDHHVVIDAYRAGSGLLNVGDEVRLPMPAPITESAN